jgi:tetratricopeptide (TPR) repeat protein
VPALSHSPTGAGSKWRAEIGVAQRELGLGQYSRVERIIQAILNEIQEVQGADIPSPLADDVRRIRLVAEALLGQTLTAQGRIEEATTVLRHTITDFESMPDEERWTSHDWAAYGVALDLVGRPREAVQALQTAIDFNDPSQVICRRLGALLAAADRLDLAEQVLRRGLRTGASDVQSIRLLADVLKASNRPQESADSYYQAGLVAASARRFGEALELFREAVDLDPAAQLYLAIGDMLRQLGHPEEALEALTRSLELEPILPVALTTQSDVLCQLGRYEEASFAAERALTIDPNDPWAMSTRGQALRNLGSIEEARAVLRAAVAHAPDLSWAWAELGETERLLGHAKEAIRATEEALRRDPTHHLALGVKGLALSQLGQQEQAAKTLQVLTKLSPDNAWAWGQYGKLLRALGRTSEALSALEQAVQLDTSLDWAAADLAALQENVAREIQERSHTAESPEGLATGRWRWRSPF